MLELCTFCSVEEGEIETHLSEDHNIVFGVDFLTDIYRLSEANTIALKNILKIFKEKGNAEKEVLESIASYSFNEIMKVSLEAKDSSTDNLEDIGDVSDNLEDIGEVTDNLEDTGGLSNNLEDIGDVSEELNDGKSENECNDQRLSLQEDSVNSGESSEIDKVSQDTNNSKYTFVCQFCEQKFTGLEYFLAHIKNQEIHSEDIRAVLACPYVGCENVLEHNNGNLDSPLHCPVKSCNFKPAWNSYYYNNIKDFLRTPSASWKMLSTIEDHINAKHAGVNAFTCEKCGKGFKSKMSYEYHKRKHLDSIFCDSCQHFFSSTDKYVNHNNKCGNQGSKQYSCDNCDKKFHSQGTLYNHKRIHSDVKFSCDICGKTFSQKGNRNTHRAKKHVGYSIGHSVA